MLALCALTVFGMALAARLSFQSGFLEYLSEIEQERVSALAEELEEIYEQAGSWDTLREPRNWRNLLNRFTRQRLNEGQVEKQKKRKEKAPEKTSDQEKRSESDSVAARPGESAENKARRTWESVQLRSSLGLVSADRAVLVAGNAPGQDAFWTALDVNGTTVGWLTRARLSGITDVIDLRFQEKQRTAIIVIAGFGLCLAALLSMLLARTLIAPLRRFADTVRQLSSGNFSARVSHSTAAGTRGAPADELQTLAVQLNHLAGVLETNEQARRAFIAEIAHDLRTPLAVLRGEIEALEDGLRPVTPESLSSLRAEVELLSRLVDDIQTLSLADLGMLAFSRTIMDVSACFLAALASTEERILARGLCLDLRLTDTPVLVKADAARLTQVFRNVLENSLRYTDAGGVIQVRCHHDEDRVFIDIVDSPPAVPEEQLPFLFDRFHTGDAARNRHRSGSGLGLAICRTLLEAQDGDIRALPSPLGGLWVRMSLPLAEKGT